MRRSTLWMCALLVTTTFGCERIKPRVAPISAAFNNAMAAMKVKIEGWRVRFLHKKPAPAVAPAEPAAPVAAAPAEPPPPPEQPAPAHPARPARAEPVPQIPVIGPGRVRDVPYVSQDTGTVFPGMAERDVYSLWGAPAAVRHRGAFTFLFFQNGCEYSCGMMDVVTLESGRVIDAVLRWPGHNYAGQSTSPTGGEPTAPPEGGDHLRITPDTVQAPE